MLAYSVQQSVTRLHQQVLLKSRLTKLALDLAAQTHALLCHYPTSEELSAVFRAARLRLVPARSACA